MRGRNENFLDSFSAKVKISLRAKVEGDIKGKCDDEKLKVRKKERKKDKRKSIERTLRAPY